MTGQYEVMFHPSLRRRTMGSDRKSSTAQTHWRLSCALEGGRHAWQDWYITHRPGLVSDHWHFYGREEVFSKVATFCIVPCKGILLNNHEMVHKLALGRPKEVTGVYLVNKRFSLESIVARWLKGQRVSV